MVGCSGVSIVFNYLFLLFGLSEELVSPRDLTDAPMLSTPSSSPIVVSLCAATSCLLHCCMSITHEAAHAALWLLCDLPVVYKALLHCILHTTHLFFLTNVLMTLHGIFSIR